MLQVMAQLLFAAEFSPLIMAQTARGVSAAHSIEAFVMWHAATFYGNIMCAET